MGSVCYLCRWFYLDPRWQHHARVQRLSSNPEVNNSSTVDSPNVLAAAAHADQTDTSCNTQVTFYVNTHLYLCRTTHGTTLWTPRTLKSQRNLHLKSNGTSQTTETSEGSISSGMPLLYPMEPHCGQAEEHLQLSINKTLLIWLDVTWS